MLKDSPVWSLRLLKGVFDGSVGECRPPITVEEVGADLGVSGVGVCVGGIVTGPTHVLVVSEVQLLEVDGSCCKSE